MKLERNNPAPVGVTELTDLLMKAVPDRTHYQVLGTALSHMMQEVYKGYGEIPRDQNGEPSDECIATFLEFLRGMIHTDKAFGAAVAIALAASQTVDMACRTSNPHTVGLQTCMIFSRMVRQGIELLWRKHPDDPTRIE